ncbi:MAG: sigma-70 family RNA polymerase sigma factor [Deltaproteobacteria bacterium]|nr:sigma-70 family RNA polymerase sigma factor [Deltaproteobacteria bacterium]
MSPADEWLLQIAQTQNKEAFASLFQHYAPRLKSFVMSLGATATVADEVVQESLISVWRRAGQFDPERGSSSAWLFSITRNTFISHVRKQKRHEASPEDPTLASHNDTPEARAISSQARHNLQEALASLPPEQASVLRSAYIKGQPLRVIAEQQNLPLGTVKTRARLALEKLRALWNAKESS